MRTIFQGATAKFPYRNSWELEVFINGRSIGIVSTAWLHWANIANGTITGGRVAFKKTEEAKAWLKNNEQFVVFIKSNDESCKKADDLRSLYLVKPTALIDDNHVEFTTLERITSPNWFNSKAA